ncbi:CAP Gly-rich domain-containing protein [Vararia minispora EC-137]|uniref:CAP Gly-rich domain-containing protein n=1 Tax=Vararia minispora EC-137 TaxID=1314806 RepID=A0ACB8QRN5_9AGAM|nr:CAP Gly-rich domain-containing protein [Vararia minispora EC-137]
MAALVTVWVASPDTRSERRFDLRTTVAELKAKLELITGIPPENQHITLCDTEQSTQPLAVLSDDSKALGAYFVRDWQWLKIEDTNPASTWTGRLNDMTGVEKFELTEEQYAARQGSSTLPSAPHPSAYTLVSDSVLAYKQRHKVGRFAPKDALPEPVSAAHLNIPLDARCQVESAEEGFSKRGTVRFVGPTKFGGGTGVWVGVEYDEPIGKNDGSVNGERYFECNMKYGVFVRPERVEVGDFPVEEINFDDEEI